MKYTKYLFILLGILIFASCEKNEVNPDVTQANKEYLFNLMHDWYLWENDLPENISIDRYPDQETLLDAMMSPLDKWSFIIDADTYYNYYQSGTSADPDHGVHGISFAYTDNGLYVVYAYEGMQAHTQGLDRGSKVLEINGTDVSNLNSEEVSNLLGDNKIGISNTLVVQQPPFLTYDEMGNTVSNESFIDTLTLTKEALAISPVLYSSIINVENKKIGYLVFKTFIEPAVPALKEKLAYFSSQGIDELVLDLRYNGGGRVNVAEELASMICPTSAYGEILIKYIHNDLRASDNDESVAIKQGDVQLDLNKLYILSTSNTASASELIANGLEPYMDVNLIGTNTHGKYVGSYGFENNDFIYSIIAFKVANANDKSDYADGLPVDILADDGIEYRWGDIQEPMLASAIEIITGISTSARKSSGIDIWESPRNKKFKEEMDKEVEMVIFK